MAEQRRQRSQEIAALRTGLDLGRTLIDTAEMYADGGAEELVAEAITDRRNEVFLVTKVLPSHASRRGIVAACDRSLRRLRTDRIDLYLLHWRGETPLEERLEGFDNLLRAGKIRYWGVSNFDVADMGELVRLPGGRVAATDQVLYNLSRRGVENDLLPWCRRSGIPIIAYSPIEEGRLIRRRALQTVAKRHNVSPAQVALAWLIRQDGVIAIPKAGTPEHVRQNRAALDLRLTKPDLAALDGSFPPPTRSRPLEVV